MSDKDLQRVTKCVSYIGQAVLCRRALASHRYYVTRKVLVTSQCTFYTSVHDDEHPAEMFLRLNGSDRSAELISLYDVVTPLMSLALQHGAPEKVGDLLPYAQFATWGPVSEHHRLKHCSSLPDVIGRHLLMEYCVRHELGMFRSARWWKTHHDFESARISSGCW